MIALAYRCLAVAEACTGYRSLRGRAVLGGRLRALTDPEDYKSFNLTVGGQIFGCSMV